MMSRTSPSTFAASAAFARPGPIAAATSAGVDPSGTSFTDPSGSAILNILVMLQACSEPLASSQPNAHAATTVKVAGHYSLDIPSAVPLKEGHDEANRQN